MRNILAILVGLGWASGAVAAAPHLTYLPSATPQLRMDLDGEQIMVTLLQDDMLHVAYGPHLVAGTPYFSPMIANPAFKTPNVHWEAATQTLSTPRLAVVPDKGCLRISDLGEKPARVLTQLCLTEASKTQLKLSLSAEKNTEVLGLGQQLSTLRSTPSWLGQKRRPGEEMGNAMVSSDIAASGDTQVPVAYVLGEGRRNYGLFFDTPYPLKFDFTDALWRVQSPAPEMGVFVFVGADLKSLRRSYLQLTGAPPVPPLKAFGMWISEYGYDNWGELDDKLKTLAQNNFPVDGAVLDLQWFGGIYSGSEETPMGGLSWDTRNFPEPAKKLAEYGARGVGIVLIEESYVGSARPEHRELAQRGFLAKDCAPPCARPAHLESNSWWGIGGMIDWSNPEAGAWWHTSKRAPLINDGVLGHWTDLGEPEQYAGNGQYFGYDWYDRHVTGHRDVHNLYNFFWSQGIANALAHSHPTHRPWILSRSGTAGSQRFGVAMWSGDVASSFAALDAQMTAQANMSLSGFDFYGSDVGGFQRQSINRKNLDTLYTRWFATSALLDVPLRPHAQNLCNCTETAPDRVGDRASNLAALTLRYRLTPYLYSLAHAAHKSGEVVFPPLVYHFQDDRAARKVVTTKMIGPWLLFGALSTSADTHATYLPQGTWTDFYTPERRVSSVGAYHTQSVLVDGHVRAPLFLRAGAIVPLLREAPHTLGIVGGTGIHWFSDLVIRTVPAPAESRFVLVEDDGISRAYETGQGVKTQLSAQETTPGHYRLAVTPENAQGMNATRTLTLEVMTGGTPITQVRVNDQALTRTAWSAENGQVTVRLGTHPVSEALVVTLAP